MEDIEFKRRQAAFYHNQEINPDTGRKITIGLDTHKKLVKKYGRPPTEEVAIKPIVKPIVKPVVKPVVSVKISHSPSPPPSLSPSISRSNNSPSPPPLRSPSRSLSPSNSPLPPPPLSLSPKPKINKTLSNKPALSYIYSKPMQNSMRKYNSDDVNLILKSKNIKMLKTLSSLARYGKILKDPYIIELLARNFNVKLDNFTFDNLYDAVIYKGAPPVFDEGIYPSLLNYNEGGEVVTKWDDLAKNQWLDKLETVQELGYLQREYVIVNNEDHVKYSSLDGNVNWNDLFFDYIQRNKYIPSERLFLFINNEYDNLSEEVKQQRFRDRYSKKTRY